MTFPMQQDWTCNDGASSCDADYVGGDGSGKDDEKGGSDLATHTFAYSY